MKHTTRGARRLSAAVVLLLALGACGGNGGDDAEEAVADPVTLEDLKPTADHFSRRLDAPQDLGLPERWDLISGSLKHNLSTMLERSFADPKTWPLTNDAEAVGAVTAGFGAIGEQNAADLGRRVLESAQQDAVEGQRLATRYASTFPADAQPAEAYVFKAKWDASVDEASSTVTVRAVVWAGYEVGGEPVVVAREMSLSGVDQGTQGVGYSMGNVLFGGFYDFCSSVADGVLVPREDGISEEAAAALRDEFADREFRPLADAIPAVAKAADSEVQEGDDDERIRECLAEG